MQNLGKHCLLCESEKENNCYGSFRYSRCLSIIPEGKINTTHALCLQIPSINFDNSPPDRETWKILVNLNKLSAYCKRSMGNMI